MKTAKRILSVILSVCLLLSVCVFSSVPTAAADESFVKIMYVDCGRKYFTRDWLIALVNEAAYAGYTHVELGVGNDGLRFLLDDMSLTVEGTTYTDEQVSAGINAGNKAYYDNGDVNELTQSEMDAIIAAADKVGVGIIPLINSPGHMDAILDCMEYCGINGSYNGSARTVDVTNSTALAFTKALIGKYLDYFASKGCEYFNMGADEYANDVYSSGGMGFGNLVSSGKYGNFVTYVNDIAAMSKAAGMQPMAFNDGIYYASNASYGTFDADIIVSYWSSGWGGSYGYNLAPATFIAGKGHPMLNTNGDYYYIVGVNDIFTPGTTTSHTPSNYTQASGFENTTFMGSTISNPFGSKFCVWCDYPGAESQETIAANVRLAMRAMALRMDGQSIDNMDTSEIPGGFAADGSILYHEHTFGEWETVSEPSCETEGQRVRTCTDCGDTETEVIAALGHSYGEWETAVEPTCTESGILKRRCGNCGREDNSSIEPTGHTYIESVTAPTCTEEGFTTYTCDCGDTYNDDYVDALGHSFGDWETVTEPTCTETGLQKHKCGVCGVEETRSTEIVEHTYNAVVTAPTCTEGGFTTYTCDCGETYTDDYVDALGHSFGEWEVITEPTCTENGLQKHVCVECGIEETQSVDKLPHNYSSVVTAPTCTEGGFTTYTCDCGDTYTDDYVDALGHSYTETVVEPTREAQGYTLYTCDVCGYSYKDNFVEYVPVPIFTVSDATGYRSKQIELKVSVVDNPGIAAFIIGFDYDKSALTLDSIVIESALGGMTAVNKNAVWLGENDLAFEGDFITLTFTVNADAAVGDYTVGLICGEGDIVNNNEDYLDFKTVCGTVTVKSHIPGDINDDGRVNSADLVRFQKYLAGVEGIVVNEEALDVNGDTEVNNKDLVLLMRYLSGEEVVIY